MIPLWIVDRRLCEYKTSPALETKTPFTSSANVKGDDTLHLSPLDMVKVAEQLPGDC